ncbi:TVP38/TMEM64 family protein [Virgisporangium ochraceum]|uniref:TVP38/TMEM64 family membrane protein n=2 Tax=Virgisporangium ochraceum TaxID=65505 RepID=A0A8J4E9K0_9ACTN|nr:TVP38/TMEM64 family protein [Virgisporangium ochraceum]
MILVSLVAVLFVTALVAGPDRDTLMAAARGGGFFAPVAAVVGSALLVAAMVPRTWLAFAGGALFGSLAGAVYVLVGVTVGASLAFLVGRLLGRSFVSAKLRGRFALIEAAVARRGVWAVVVCRLIPIVPFAISNYAFGTTSVRPRQMIAGTMLGALPANFAYAALGAATMQQDWLGAKVAGGCVLALGACGVMGTYLVWRRRPHAVAPVSLTKSLTT